MNTRHALASSLLLAGCVHAAGGVLDTKDPYTNRVVATAGLPAERSSCAPMPFDLGVTWKASIPDRSLELTLPSTYQAEPGKLMSELTTAPNSFPPNRRFPDSRQWSPGLWLPGAWDRFIRFRDHSNRLDAVFQVGIGKGYPLIAPEPSWKLVVSTECILQVRRGTVRVLLFRLIHPTYPTQWGMSAFWRDFGDGWNPTHYLTAFAIGPDEAFQAEALQILGRQGPP